MHLRLTTLLKFPKAALKEKRNVPKPIIATLFFVNTHALSYRDKRMTGLATSLPRGTIFEI